MKQITQERILKALDKAAKYLNQKPERHVVQTLSLIGLKTMIGNQHLATDRERLELAYQGYSDPEQVFKRLSRLQATQNFNTEEALFEAWYGSFERLLAVKWKRDEKIRKIQRNHQVSSLELTTSNLGDVVVQFHEPIDQLDVIDSDREVMLNERMKVARKFLNATRKCNFNLYQWSPDHDEWIFIKNRRRILWLAADYVWPAIPNMKPRAYCYEVKEYVNQEELTRKGYAEVKRERTSIHDRERWEFHLVLEQEDYKGDSKTHEFASVPQGERPRKY